MTPHQLTIQTFYSREIPKTVKEQRQGRSVAAIEAPGDGFTEEEIANTLDPLQTKFNPTREYSELVIAAIEAGPHATMFTGRIVNFSLHYGKSKSQQAARGWHHLIVKDDTGAICVKLYFAREPYTLKLGLMISIWTPFISEPAAQGRGTQGIVVESARFATNIFPGRDGSVNVVLHSSMARGCRTPLDYTPGVELGGLMTLKSFLAGGHEVADARILVFVKSIGAKKTITTKKGTQLALLEVVVFDDTANAVLKLWDAVALAAGEWKASATILLMTRPGFRFEYRGTGSLGITPHTMVEVDPEFADADWLRRYAARAHRAQSVKQEWPEGVFDVEAAINGAHRILFTLADVDEWARLHPHQAFTGFLSLTILDFSLELHARRAMLLISECCGVPIYGPSTASQPPPALPSALPAPAAAPATSSPPTSPTASSVLETTCPHCASPVQLALNPKVVGNLIDETGCISGAKLLWRAEAWTEMFGRPVEEIVRMQGWELRLLEQRMWTMRVHFVFGWCGRVGRLAILGVRM